MTKRQPIILLLLTLLMFAVPAAAFADDNPAAGGELNPPAITEIAAVDSISLYRTGTFRISPVVTNPQGPTSFTSADPSTASVDAAGIVVAKNEGNTIVTVRNGAASKAIPVHVANPSLSTTTITLTPKKTANISIIGLIGKASFKSKNKKVATVSAKGKIKAKKKGKTTITVKANGITLKCKVVVKKAKKKTAKKKKKKNSGTVYVTATGERYHCRQNCYGLRHARAVYKMSRQEAIEEGFTPCHVCY